MTTRLPRNLCLLLCLWVSPALALHFTDPPPRLEMALHQAIAQGRPLVLVFSATWCGPCKRLARDLKKPAGRAAQDRVLVVIYDGEADPGQELMVRYRLNGFPSLVALDRTGAEVDRTQGYGTWDDMDQWLRGIPDRALPLQEALAAAERPPQSGERFLSLGKRLLQAGRLTEARRLFLLTEQTGPKKAAARAAWQLTLLDHSDSEHAHGAALATALAERYPGTDEADRALSYLAAMPQPPTQLINRLLVQRSQEEKSMYALVQLSRVALKASAYQAAHLLGQRLAQVASEHPAALAARAEIAFLGERQTAQAVTLMEDALSRAKGLSRDTYRESLERFHRDQGELPRELANFDAPGLLPSLELGEAPPPWYQRQRKVEQAISRECWASAPAQSLLNVVVLGGRQGPRLAFRPGTPPALISCATRILQAAEWPAESVQDLKVALAPPAQPEAIEEALGRAEEECQELAGADQSLDLVLSGSPGGALQVEFGGGSAELRHCVSTIVSTVRLQVTLLQVEHLRFTAPKKAP